MALPFNTLLTVDFETRYDSKEYSLRKLTTEAYIRDPRFKAFGVCIHEYGTDKPVMQYYHEEIPRILATYDWSKTAVLAQNTMFDAGILSFVYNVHPCFLMDTLSMARAFRGPEAKNSLAVMAEEYGFPAKGTAIAKTDGIWDPDKALLDELMDYCKHDVVLCEQIFAKLLHRIDITGQSHGTFPTKELRLIDMTLKMFTRPELVLDTAMLENALTEDNAKLDAALQRAGVTASELGSNDMFAEALRRVGVEPPTKPSPANKDKQIFAFAKSDALFQSILNGDNEEAVLLCEARLKVKSTQERTRAQRFIDIAQRGALPVPLQYYGAGTGRYSATGSINLQNLKRGSALRKAIMAPEGYVVCAGDLSQIEPRVLAWLSDYDDMLNIFRSGGDPYATFGSQMFGIPGLTKETHPLLRQSAKSALLGCFGSQTPVLTKRGWVSIVEVTKEDLLWDGVEWVGHQGLLAQGEKDVLTMYGVSATADHEILTEHGWVGWSEVLASPSHFLSAIALGNSPAFAGMNAQCTGRSEDMQCSPGSAALAGGRGISIAGTCAEAGPRAATPAPKPKHAPHDLLKQGWQLSAPTPHIGSGFSTALVPSLCAALTRTAARIQTMVGAASRCIQNGWQTALRFSAISSVSLAGIGRSYSLTGSTTTQDTNRAIYASLLEARTCLTSVVSQLEKSLNCAAGSQPLRQRMQTYDIAMAGPRNRFTILTDEGPIIVHNCGYQLGWASFAGQLLVGFLGAPPQRYNKADAKQLGVSARDIERFVGSPDMMQRMMDIPHTCTDEELLIHCLAAKAIIDKYRAAAHPVQTYWNLLGSLIEHSLVGGKEYNHKDVLIFRKEEIEMVNGMRLYYRDIKAERDKRGSIEYSFSTGRKRKKLYPGLLANNTTQGLARIIMTDGLLRVQKKFPVKGTVHDEGLFLIPDDNYKETNCAWIKQEMIQVPKWMPGIPLNADVGFNRRYGLAKG